MLAVLPLVQLAALHGLKMCSSCCGDVCCGSTASIHAGSAAIFGSSASMHGGNRAQTPPPTLSRLALLRSPDSFTTTSENRFFCVFLATGSL